MCLGGALGGACRCLNVKPNSYVVCPSILETRASLQLAGSRVRLKCTGTESQAGALLVCLSDLSVLIGLNLRLHHRP